MQEYAFRVVDSSYVTLEHMKFSASTVWAAATGYNDDVTGIQFDSLSFYFPSTQKRMLGGHRHSWPVWICDLLPISVLAVRILTPKNR